MNKPVLSPAFLQELAENNPIGMQLDSADVQAWFDLIWLKFKTHRYKQQKRAIISWWSRVRESEIDDARARVTRMRDDAQVAAIEASLGNVIPIRRPGVDHFAKLGRGR